ncbi:MAG TPA: divalent-cation tolerance protein CutA [Candidatus Thermoplasmatota archaeon]|jgi:periplasmic divalent cation tolerance protein|nr:divalent-cation tolerance protein CutA [Candidatus Thermoplasmatota archaeon]
MFASVYVTASSMAEAEALARKALDARLAACANAWPLQSWYWWQGKVEHAEEAALLLKTRRELVPQLTALLEREHSYDVPCVVAWPIAEGSADYLAWVAREASAKP